MPLDSSDFPEEVQVAFFVFSLLSDNWDGMSGTYLGKVWSNIDYIFELYAIDNPKVIFFFMKMYEGVVIQTYAKEADRKQKAEKRKSARGGKNYTHNVQG